MSLLKRLVALVLLLVISIGVKPVDGEEKQPNILFIFADDQCFDTIRSLGNHEIRTPNLDRLAARGVVFTDSYNMGGWHGAVCVASRTMINTGRSIWRARRAEKTIQQEVKENRFWSQLLSAAGYETYMSGKWHVKAGADKVFDRTAHIRPGMPRDTKEGYLRPIKGAKDVWTPWDPKFGGFWAGGKHWSEVLADDAANFLTHASASDAPFFMYLAFNAPHDPRQAPKEFVDMYPTEEISVPTNFLASYPNMEAIGVGKKLRDERLAPWPRTHYAVKVHRREYYALITHMDAQIGKILDSLNASGKADNTYIFFTADHGLAVGQHGLLGKQNMYEHSMRTPLIVVGPDMPEGKKVTAPVYLQDVMPTTLELAGAKIPDHVEFKSLLPLIRNQKDVQYSSIYGTYQEKLQRMVRKDNFKLIHYPPINKTLLFDLKNDPHELIDLADDPEQKSRRESLESTLQELQVALEDPLASR